jgi:hypothetical protein
VPFWIRTVLVYLSIAAGLIAAFGVGWETGANLVILAAGMLPGIIKHSPRLFLGLQRLKYYVANTETIWEMAIQFHGPMELSRLDKLIQELLAHDPKGSQLLQRSSSRYLLRYNRIFTIEFEFIDLVEHSLHNHGTAAASPAMHMMLFEQRIGFRSSRAILEHSLVPLIERISVALKPESTSYALKVRFIGSNPFVGMYLQQLKPELVRDFQFEFVLPNSGPRDYVQVDRENLVVWSDSLESFRRGALSGLTFSAGTR